ncbi:hypothetical protein [Cysteiniphilum sp. 6C5]|uniref:hypothetical protein n=1 Tax=unclassified Cysteiniphilum TaxID=2610889 RepID=UPI003F875017
MSKDKLEYTITQEKVIDILMHAANRQDFAEFKRDMSQDMVEFKKEIKSDIAQFKNDVNTRIDKLDGRIDKLDGRIDKLSTRVDRSLLLQVTTLLFLFATIGIPYVVGFFK